MITAHMIVKNEDQWIWFAIQSVLPYVDKFLITDTGSTDSTVKIIKSIQDKKIDFNQVKISSPSEITAIRQDQVDKTKSGWIWLVDGDEIYSKILCQEIVDQSKKKLSTIAVRRYDLLGDVYHFQDESVGAYGLYGHSGHLVTRLMNTDKIKGLHLSGDYPDEGYFDKDGKSTQEIDIKKVYVTKHKLHHAMYLKRSSQSDNKILNRNKYKIEKGIKVKEPLPSIFYKSPDVLRLSPLKRRSRWYEFKSSIITPFKKIKRSIS